MNGMVRVFFVMVWVWVLSVFSLNAQLLEGSYENSRNPWFNEYSDYVRLDLMEDNTFVWSLATNRWLMIDIKGKWIRRGDTLILMERMAFLDSTNRLGDSYYLIKSNHRKNSIKCIIGPIKWLEGGITSFPEKRRHMRRFRKKTFFERLIGIFVRRND